MSLTAKTPSDLDTLDLLVYGRPGSGKTYLTGTAQQHEETKNVIMADVDGGAKTLKGNEVPDAFDNIETVPINTTKEMRDFKEWIRLHVQNKDDDEKIRELNEGLEVSDPDMRFNTVVVDTLTKLQYYSLSEASGLVDDDDHTSVADIQTPSQRNYGQNMQFIMKTITNIVDLDINTIFTAHMSEGKDDRGRDVFNIELAGKLQNQVGGEFDVVGYLHSYEDEEGNNVRKLLTEQRRGITAKDRFGVFPNEIEEPTIPEMMEYINGAQDS